MENQIIAASLAKSFVESIGKKLEKSIKFLEENMIFVESEGKYFTCEEFLSGDFDKWTSNHGTLNEEIYSNTLDAFSHWSYQATNEYLIVTDLQGFCNKKDPVAIQFVLTDPAIICPEHFDRFSSTNLGIKGVKKYFENHQCNQICRGLVLSRHKYQAKPDRISTPVGTKLK